jgi:hypothetical protein
MMGIWQPTNYPNRWHVDFDVSFEESRHLDRIADSYFTLGRIVAQKCVRAVLNDPDLQDKLFAQEVHSAVYNRRWVQIWLGKRTFVRVKNLALQLGLEVPDLCAKGVCLILRESETTLHPLLQAFVEGPDHH